MTQEGWISLYLMAYEAAGGERSEEAAIEYAKCHIERFGLEADAVDLAHGDVEIDAL